MTDTRTCTACDNPAADGVTICKRCDRMTRRRLGDMEAHRQELETAMTRQTRLSAPQDGGRSANTPLPYETQASDLLTAQRSILVSWCRLVHDEISNTWPRRNTVRSMSLHLEAHMPELRKHEACGDLVDEIRTLVDQVMACIDYPEDRQRSKVGRCIIVAEGEPCPGQIHLHLPHEGSPYAKCQTCGTRWESEQLNRLGQRIVSERISA